MFKWLVNLNKKKDLVTFFQEEGGAQFKEQRQHKRFAAKLPVRLEAITSSRLRHLYVETKDISATGAFVFTKEASYIPDDTRFIIDLTIPKKRNKKWKDFINCTGTIVRSTSEGIAIRFNRPVELFV